MDAAQLRSQASYLCHLSRPYWYTKRCIHPSQRCIFSRQNTDNIFQIETTALAHVVCAPQESGILLTTLRLHIPVSITLGSSLCSRKQSCLVSSAASCKVFTTTAPRTWHSLEQLVGFFYGQRCETWLSSERLSSCDGLRPEFQMAPRNSYPKEP